MKNKLFILLAAASLNASVNAWNYLPEWLVGKKEEAKPAVEVKPEVKEENAPAAEVKPADVTEAPVETVATETPAEAAK